MGEFLKSIPAAASSPYALAAYTIAALLFLFAGARLRMTQMLMAKITVIPEAERRRALEIATGTVLPTQVSPEQWIRHSRLRWTFLLLGALLIVLLAVGTIAILNPTRAALEDVTKTTQQTARETQSTIQEGTQFTTKKMDEATQEIITTVNQLNDPDLQVEYYVEQYTGANVLIGNRGQGIIIVSELRLHWDYRECAKFEKSTTGAPFVEYRYEVNLTKARGSKLLDTREFKYGAGDVDKFLADLHFPDYGIYTIWLTFSYRKLGDRASFRYESQHIERFICEKW